MQKKYHLPNEYHYKSISIVIPIYNEEGSILKLINEIINIQIKKFEIIIVNDGSNDNSEVIINNLLKSSSQNIIYIKHDRNYGQSLALLTGIKKSKYETIVTIDGDGQNDPSDITKLLKLYHSNNYSLVGGLRLKRMDNLTKIISSKIANYLRKMILNDDCDDTGCSLKIFDKTIFMNLPVFDGMHRYLPALFKSFGGKCIFVEVNHRSRISGMSNYGTIDRLVKGVRDMIKVYKIIKNNKIHD